MQHPIFAIALTLIVYLLAQKCHERWRWLHPLFATCATLIALLLWGNIPYEEYKIGGDVISFFLGPATIALGVPLYKHAARLKASIKIIVASVTVGCISSIASAALSIWLFQGPREVLLSMLPKSATAAISIEIVRQLGGLPELGVVFTVLTGLVGSMIGPGLLRMAGIRHDLAIGIAMGTAAHGIGTARVVRHSEAQGSASAFAMALGGIITSILCALLGLLIE